MNYLKNELRMSYKKGSIRQFRIDEQKLYYVRVLHAQRLSCQLREDTMIVNVDETSLSRSISNSRWWIPRGWNREVYTIKFSGSVSLIMAVTSSGHYLAVLIVERVCSNHFLEFIESMEGWLNKTLRMESAKVIILLDNCSTHRSKEWREYMMKSQATYMFIPQYSPQLAPIELVFGIFKNKLMFNK